MENQLITTRQDYTNRLIKLLQCKNNEEIDKCLSDCGTYILGREGHGIIKRITRLMKDKEIYGKVVAFAINEVTIYRDYERVGLRSATDSLDGRFNVWIKKLKRALIKATPTLKSVTIARDSSHKVFLSVKTEDYTEMAEPLSLFEKLVFDPHFTSRDEVVSKLNVDEPILGNLASELDKITKKPHHYTLEDIGCITKDDTGIKIIANDLNFDVSLVVKALSYVSSNEAMAIIVELPNGEEKVYFCKFLDRGVAARLAEIVNERRQNTKKYGVLLNLMVGFLDENGTEIFNELIEVVKCEHQKLVDKRKSMECNSVR